MNIYIEGSKDHACILQDFILINYIILILMNNTHGYFSWLSFFIL